MSTLLGLLVVVLAISIYIYVGFLTFKAMNKLFDFDRCSIWPELGGMVWPIASTFILAKLFLIATSKLRFPKIRKEAKASELFPGVERPTFILANMVAAQIIKNFSAIECNRWSDSKMSLSWDTFSSGNPYNMKLSLKDKKISFNDESSEILIKAIRKARTLKEEHKKLEKQSALEHEALSVIELMTVGEPEKKEN